MHLEKMILHNFKNHESSDFDFHPQINLIVGDNGVGKTNVLDAIYFLAWTRSKSNLTDAQLKRDGVHDYRVDAKITHQDEHNIYSFRHEKGTKKLFCNKELITYRLDHIGKIPLISIFPNDVNLIYQDSSVRRSFMDQYLSQLYPEYLAQVSRLRKIVAQKTALLKNSQTKDKGFFDLLDLYNQDLHKVASYLVPFRNDVMTKLDKVILQEYEKISGNPDEKVSLKYKERKKTDHLYQLLTDHQQEEIMMKKTLYGPHKDDLDFRLNGGLLKKYGSQGQVKTYLVALKLSLQQLYKDESGNRPILLLDDLFDKLDHRRIEKLLEVIVDEELGQLFITTTSEDYLELLFNKWNLDFSKFVIADGRPVPISV